MLGEVGEVRKAGRGRLRRLGQRQGFDGGWRWAEGRDERQEMAKRGGKGRANM